jgi:RNA polymerase sigma-70 factor (ECF subfamily)
MNLLISSDNPVPFRGSLRMLNDELLVLAAKSGDVTAFAELRRRHSSRLLRTTYRITRNWEDAEDAVQNSFLKVFLHLNRFESRSSFASWLTSIGINSALMIMRKKRSREISIDGLNDDSGASERWELPDLREDPERCYARNEREELLKNAIRRLRPKFREVVELQRTGELSTNELAQLLGVSVPAVKSRLARARMALRTSLQAKRVHNDLKVSQIESRLQ